MFSIATSDEDFGSSMEQITLPATMSGGSMSIFATASISDDTILEFSEDFSVSFNTSEPLFGIMIASPNTTTVTIIDDGMLSRITTIHIKSM